MFIILIWASKEVEGEISSEKSDSEIKEMGETADVGGVIDGCIYIG